MSDARYFVVIAVVYDSGLRLTVGKSVSHNAKTALCFFLYNK